MFKKPTPSASICRFVQLCSHHAPSKQQCNLLRKHSAVVAMLHCHWLSCFRAMRPLMWLESVFIHQHTLWFIQLHPALLHFVLLRMTNVISSCEMFRCFLHGGLDLVLQRCSLIVDCTSCAAAFPFSFHPVTFAAVSSEMPKNCGFVLVTVPAPLEQAPLKTEKCYSVVSIYFTAQCFDWVESVLDLNTVFFMTFQCLSSDDKLLKFCRYIHKIEWFNSTDRLYSIYSLL